MLVIERAYGAEEVPVREEEKRGCIWNTYRLGDTGRCIVVAQQILKNLGYYKGEIDGKFTKEFQDALIRFQQSTEGLEVTGELDTATWGVLLWYANPEQKCWITPYIEGCEWLREKLAGTGAGVGMGPRQPSQMDTLILLGAAGVLAFLLLRKKK